jgi:hypothetical protein
MVGKLIDEKTQALLARERVLLDDAVVFLTDSVGLYMLNPVDPQA